MFRDALCKSSTPHDSTKLARRRALLLAATVIMCPTRAHAGWPSNGLVVGDSAVTRFQPTVALASDGSHGTFSFANPWHLVTRIDPDGAPLWEVAPYATSFPRGTALVPDGAGGVWVVHSASTDVLAGHWDASGIPLGGNVTVAHDANGTRFLATAFADGAGGFFAVWTDVPTAGEDDLRGAHVDATGAVTTPAAGRLLVGGAGAQVFAGAVPDGQGGFVLMYPFGAGENLQRFGPALTPTWAASAARIQPPGAYGDFSLVASGDGGVFVTWIAGPSTSGAVRLLRIDPAGALAVGWPVDGVAVASPLIQPSMPQMALDRSGGVLVAWIDQHVAPGGGFVPDVRVSRRLGDGSLASNWPALGALAGSTGSPALDARSALVADGAGGCFIAWSDAGASGPGVRAQHLSAAGTPAAGWSSTATLLGGAGFPSFTSPVLVTDDAGGAYAAWDEYQYPYLAHEGLNVMRLTRLLPGGIASAGPPPASIALGMAFANPVRGDFTASVVLPDDRAAALELFDLAGRVMFRRELAGAGRHDVLLESGRMPAGVNWLRLSHASGVRTARVVVLR